MAFPSHWPPCSHKIAAAAPNIPSKPRAEEKALGPAKSSSFIRNRTNISRTCSRLPYASFCLDQCHMATCSCKRCLLRLVTLPALARRKIRMDIDSVSSHLPFLLHWKDLEGKDHVASGPTPPCYAMALTQPARG